jgi:hypothetical protein
MLQASTTLFLEGRSDSMTSNKEVPTSPLHDKFVMEIVGEELFQYQDQLRATLDTLCLSEIFRNSPKSCEFIRHVVYLSLESRVDELKERLIGMSLLGRDASYDTSTDSGVRVRANNVRKRLIKFNESEGVGQEFWIVLPTGTYVPRFFRAGLADANQVSASPQTTPLETLSEDWPAATPDPGLPLSLFQLAVPTLAAIFLCIICMRWQLSQEHSFTNFWHEVLQGDQALLYLTPFPIDGKQGMVAIQALNEATPLLDLEGQFHHKFTLVSEPGPVSKPSQTSLYVGLNSTSDLHADNFASIQSSERFQLVTETGNRMVVDRRNGTRTVIYHAALLTIVNGRRRSIYIDGTDDNAVQSLVNRLCDESSFPGLLADSFRPGTITQAMFPTEMYAKGILDQQPLTHDMAALKRLP